MATNRQWIDNGDRNGVSNGNGNGDGNGLTWFAGQSTGQRAFDEGSAFAVYDVSQQRGPLAPAPIHRVLQQGGQQEGRFGARVSHLAPHLGTVSCHLPRPCTFSCSFAPSMHAQLLVCAVCDQRAAGLAWSCGAQRKIVSNMVQNGIQPSHMSMRLALQNVHGCMFVT